MEISPPKEMDMGRLFNDFDLGDDVLLSSFVHLTESDQLKVLEWRNHPSVRQWMFQQEPISISAHLKFIKNLQHHNRFYWILKVKGQEIGVLHLRFFSLKSSEWGFYLNPTVLGSGRGIILMYHALQFFFHHLPIQKLYGLVLQDNTNALFLHDLFYIRHQASVPYTTGKTTLMCECRSISRADWWQQAASMEMIKRRMIHKKDDYHQLKAATLHRQTLLKRTSIDEDILACSGSRIKE